MGHSKNLDGTALWKEYKKKGKKERNNCCKKVIEYVKNK